jgi:hypothetical protein
LSLLALFRLLLFFFIILFPLANVATTHSSISYFKSLIIGCCHGGFVAKHTIPFGDLPLASLAWF